MTGNTDGTPFLTVPLHLQTVRGLHAALSALLERHADTEIVYADYECGPQTHTKLELYDFTHDIERGELSGSPLKFLMC